jgi:chitodextrinase
VLPGDHGPDIPTLPAGTYPAWSNSHQYQEGDKVLYQGLPYEAKWANQGDSPASQASDPSGSPWKALYSIPGEPNGSPALGVNSTASPSSSSSATPTSGATTPASDTTTTPSPGSSQGG